MFPTSVSAEMTIQQFPGCEEEPKHPSKIFGSKERKLLLIVELRTKTELCKCETGRHVGG